MRRLTAATLGIFLLPAVFAAQQPQQLETSWVVSAQLVTEAFKWPDCSTVAAIILTESKGNPNARNRNSVGLMQVNAKSRADYHRLKNPMENIQSGVDLLRQYYQLLGSEREAIEAYNVGIGNEVRHRFRISAHKYLRKVLRNLPRGQEVCNQE